MIMKKNINIQILRIISMFSILFCHFKLPFHLGHLLSVGVYIFFIISGYLYGKKDIKEPKKWLCKKFIHICIPIYIWLIVVNILYILTKSNVNFYDNIYYLLNIEAFINNELTGLTHLWFVSIILICYLITPLLNKYKNNISIIKTSIIFIISIICLSYLNDRLGIYLFYFYLYIMAYLISAKKSNKNWKSKNLKKIVFLSFASIIIGCILRIISRRFLDGTILYSNILVPITQSIIAISIFYLINNISFNLKKTNIIDYFDSISYYVYIVHYIFCVGPLMIIQDFSKNWPLEALITTLISIIVATFLKYTTEKINFKKGMIVNVI